MTKHAYLAVAEKIIERHKLLRELVMNRRYGFIKDSQFRIAITAPEIAQHLIVCPVFFDDVKDVLNWQSQGLMRIKRRRGILNLF